MTKTAATASMAIFACEWSLIYLLPHMTLWLPMESPKFRSLLPGTTFFFLAAPMVRPAVGDLAIAVLCFTINLNQPRRQHRDFAEYQDPINQQCLVFLVLLMSARLIRRECGRE